MGLKPHVILHEVAGGTAGCSAKKSSSDLVKLAKGMKKHLQRIGRSVNGTSIDRARRIRVCGVQYIGMLITVIIGFWVNLLIFPCFI